MSSHRTPPRLWAALFALAPLLFLGAVSDAMASQGEGVAHEYASPGTRRRVALAAAFEHLTQEWRRVREIGAEEGWANGCGPLAAVRDGFEALAGAGCADAARVCLLDFRELRGLSDEGALRVDQIEERLELYRALVRADDFEPKAAVLSLLAQERDLSQGQVEDLMRDLTQRPGVHRVIQAQARLALARLLAPWSRATGRHGEGDARRAEAQALYDSIQQDFRGTHSAAQAHSDSWRLDHLSVGCLAPDFLTHDLAGNEIRLSDFRGQVVVVYFTDSASADCEAALALSRTQGRSHWDSRFAWVGIYRGGTRDTLRSALDASSPCGEHAFEGVGGAGAAQAWRVPTGDTLVVLDPAGCVSAINPSQSRLDRHITNLLVVLQQQGRKRQAGRGGADGGGGGDSGSGGSERPRLSTTGHIGATGGVQGQQQAPRAREDQTP